MKNGSPNCRKKAEIEQRASGQLDAKKSSHYPQNSETEVQQQRALSRDVPHTKNPPARTGGLRNGVGLGYTDSDFNNALLGALQVRFRVRALLRLNDEIAERGRRGLATVDPAEREENRRIFEQAFEVYRATWPTIIRQNFADLAGAEFDAFERALDHVGDALFFDAPAPNREFGCLLTPAALGPLTVDEKGSDDE